MNRIVVGGIPKTDTLASPHIGHGCVFLAPAGEFAVNPIWIDVRALLADSLRIFGSAELFTKCALK